MSFIGVPFPAAARFRPVCALIQGQRSFVAQPIGAGRGAEGQNHALHKRTETGLDGTGFAA
jgi:hypothetical protein